VKNVIDWTLLEFPNGHPQYYRLFSLPFTSGSRHPLAPITEREKKQIIRLSFREQGFAFNFRPFFTATLTVP